jgi:phospholipid transport system substrate-binding protein
MNRNRIIAGAAALILVLVAPVATTLAVQDTPASPADVALEPEAVVAYLHDELLASMKLGDSVDVAARRTHLEPVIEKTYDIDFVAKSVMRKHWKSLTEEQRKRFTAVFRQHTIETYTDKFDSYNGQTFESVDQRELKRGSMLVHTTLVRVDKDPVELKYVLVKRKGQWRIVNVVADGVSDLAVKRAEYASIMERDGFEGLLDKLRQKIALLAAEPG